MKKLCFFMIFLLIFSAGGCSAKSGAWKEFDADEQFALPHGKGGDVYTAEGTLSAKLLSDLNSSEMMIRFITYVTIGDKEIANETTLAKHDGAFMMKRELEGKTVRFVFQKGASAYLVDDADKTAVDLLRSGVDPSMYTPPDLSGQTFIVSGTESFMGKEMIFDEYQGDSGRVRYYFSNEKLQYIVITKENKEAVTIEVLELSLTVPETLFEIPDSYQFIRPN